jgi:protein required for attachment to host cells
MANTWILVANAAQARLYANQGPNKGVELVGEYAHPASREKGSDLVSDRPGHNQGHGNGHGAYIPHTDPKQNAADHFARHLAGMLEEARTKDKYDRLILAASPSFHGLLRQHLTSGVSKMVTGSIDKDYTSSEARELPGLLADFAVL